MLIGFSEGFMRFTHLLGIYLSGLVWLAIGCMLTFKGIVLFQATMFLEHPGALMSVYLKMFANKEKALMFLIFTALVVGLFKGKVVLSKTVNRTIKRLLMIPAPLKLKDLFPFPYLCLIAGMMSLGMILRFSPLSIDIRAFVDLAVGSALINGAFLYFKQGLLLKTELSRRKK